MEAVIAYLLYGDRNEYQRELAFSALSAQRYLRDEHRDIRLCALTDQHELQYDVGFEVIRVSADELSEWTRDGRCGHRAKPCALRKAIDAFDCPVALVDTDTWFIDHPAKLFERIAPGASVMHAYEYRLGENALWEPLLGALRSTNVVEGYTIDSEAPMYNSGVIGLHPADRDLLDDAVQLLDGLDRVTPIFNAEQFALGTVLGVHTHLAPADDVLHHYWGFERGFVHVQIARLLRGFKPESVPALMDAAASCELGLPARRWTHRLWSRTRAQLGGWDADCRFGYLAYLSALASARSDAELANAWLETALGALAISRRDDNTVAHHHRALRRAFRVLDPRSHWVDPGLAMRWREFWAT